MTAEGLQQGSGMQGVPLPEQAAWQALRDAEAAERAQQAQERTTALNAAVAAIVPLQNQQDLALLAANVAATRARGLGAELYQRHTWNEASQQAAHAARQAAERQIASPVHALRAAA